MVKLTAKREKFVQLLFSGQSQTDAYIACYNVRSDISRQRIGVAACGLAKHPDIVARLEELKQAVQKEVVMEAADVVRHLIEIATADPNELTQYRRVNCRHCHGINHAYQWKHRGEFTQAMDKWSEAEEEFTRRNPQKRYKVPEPNDKGGYGFRSNAELNPECPACEGEGIDELHIADTRKLSPAARRLYAGAKRTKNGVEIMMRSQDNALKLLGDRYGLFKTVIDSNNTNVNANINAKIDYSKLSKETLKEILKAMRDASPGS